jgi:hypothetical protein
MVGLEALLQPPDVSKRRAAEHVHASEVMFIVGATLAHIGRLQKCFQADHADSPEEARAIKSALERIKVPAQYQYPRRRR